MRIKIDVKIFFLIERSITIQKFLVTKLIFGKKVVKNDFSRHSSFYTLSKCLSIQNVARPSEIPDIIVRYRETWIFEANGLPVFTMTGNIIPCSWDIPKIREVSRSSAQKKKGRDWMLEETKIGAIASKVFQTRSHVTCVLVGRDDPPTHSCWWWTITVIQFFRIIFVLKIDD